MADPTADRVTDPAAESPAEVPPAGAASAAAVTPREGALAYDEQALFESRILTYEQMLRLTDRIADGVKALALPGPAGAAGAAGAAATYVVVTPKDLAALELYAGVAPSVRALGAAFAAVAPPPIPQPQPPPAPASRDLGPILSRGAAAITALTNPLAAVSAGVDAVRGVAQSVASLAVLFRRDVQVANSDVAIDDRALQLQVAGELAFRGLRVRVPAVYAPPNALPGVGPNGAPPAAADLHDVHDLLGAAYAAQAAAAGRVAQLPDEERAAPADRLRLLGAALAQCEALLLGAPPAGADGAGAGAAPAPPAPAADGTFRRGAALAAEVRPGAYLVRVHVLASGGSRRVTRGAVRSSVLELSGGLVANLAVFAHDGVLVGGGTWPSHSGYQTFEGRPRAVPA